MWYFVRDMWRDGWPGRLLLALFLLVLVALPLLVWATIEDGRRWDRFVVERSCRIVGKMAGDTFTTVGPVIGGQGGVAIGVGVTPSKTGWQCDDGVTYWR